VKDNEGGVAIADCHSDVMIDVARRRHEGESGVLARVHLPARREGGIRLQVCTVGGDVDLLCPLGRERPFESALALLGALESEVSEAPDALAIVRSPEEARRAVADDRFAIVPSLEGASALADGPGRLEELYGRGLRWVGLTWNGANALASGLDTPGAGLSRLGIEAVQEMNRLGVVIDVTHLSPVGFWDVVRESRAPIVASHSNARTVWDHPRNLDDSQLDAIGSSGGLVGVVLVSGFIGASPATMDDLVDHLEYIAGRIGIDSVAIGADFVDHPVDLVLKGAQDPASDEVRFQLAYQESVGTPGTLSNLVSFMRRRGISESEIEKICSENVLRVLAEVQRA
jgi:membrane dipeptidase